MIRKIVPLRGLHSLLACALVVTLTGGCAPTKSLTKAGYEEFRRSNVGIVVLVPERRIEFQEVLYKVLFSDVQTSFYSVDNIWDPAPVLGGHAVKFLSSAHAIAVVPLWQRLEPGPYRELVGRLETTFNAARRRHTANPRTYQTAFQIEWQHSPPMAYLGASRPELKHSLLGAGIDHLLELSIGGITLTRNPIQFSILVFTYARLIRLSDGAVIWDGKGLGVSQIADVEQYSQLEANNLALLKQHYEKAVMNLFDPTNGNNVLAGLQPH